VGALTAAKVFFKLALVTQQAHLGGEETVTQFF
jgi:hypothetical protein